MFFRFDIRWFRWHPISNLDGLIPSNIDSTFLSIFSRFDIRWCQWHLISNLDGFKPSNIESRWYDRHLDSILDGITPSKFDIRCHGHHLISNLKTFYCCLDPSEFAKITHLQECLYPKSKCDVNHHV